ncbi:MAG: hypothetical protein AD742_10785 [Methylibium sp. NZG]|nr:MAG: hypothetical protein AD742_10785 [Methylibium sp. NZG]
MNRVQSNVSPGKRLGAMLVSGAMLLQTVLPAHAVVSQLPGLYTTPPDANVMFTLDDSLSMLSEAIPDFINDIGGMPNTAPSTAIAGFGPRFPNLWGNLSDYWGNTYYRCSNAIARYMRSAAGNPLYYDPTVSYRPWPLPGNDTTQTHANANPAAVNIHAENPFNAGFTRDLTLRLGAGTISSGACPAANGTLGDENTGFWPATYFVYTGAAALPVATPNTPLNVSANFRKVEIQGSGSAVYDRAATRSDCTGAVGTGGCTREQEMQNFANWLQFYRTRMLMAKGGVSAAFAQQGTNLRIGFGTLNSANTVRQGVETFANARRTSFYTDLYGIASQPFGTPLRRAADDVGKYFQRTGVGNPWAENPASTTVGKEETCRKSFHILSTDGYWNDGIGTASAPASNDNDTFSGQTPPNSRLSNKVYNFGDNIAQDLTDSLVGRFTINPFKDGNAGRSGTLADVTAYYWRNDLRTDVNNEVFTTSKNPAFWQHLTTYTVGLGISGTGGVINSSGTSVNISTPQGRDALVANKTELTWTNPHGGANDNNKGDDLIHAAMNSRGNYFFATNPTALKSGLAAALAEASDNPGSLASVATESAQLSANTEVYQATYNPSQWAGRLYAFSQAANGSVNTNPSGALWEASNKMPAPDSRNIYTWNPNTNVGAPFTWAGLTATQRGHLNDDSTMLDFLRGSDARELAQNGPFRDRARYTVGAVKGGVLGDIVNGSPIKGPSAGNGYNRLPSSAPGQSSYAAFRSPSNTALDNMRDTIFVGANDGMLHAFNRNTGVERFAYVPNSVFNVPRSPTAAEQKLKMLSDPGYTHRFTVDGPPQIADAFIGTSAASSEWRNVLVGSTGAGARSVFAMDVSNPAVVSGGFGQSRLLWEFSETNNTDMGYMLSYPHVARMRDGTWVAIFGNGYDSTNGRAKLFILNLQTGAVLWEQFVGVAGGNGLSQPNFTLNNNREVTAIYAGDLKGNLWKFDVDDASPANWKVAFGSAPNYTPLFTGSANQPISVMPEITFHPNGGTLVSFGTGKLFEVEDTSATSVNVNLNTQAIYGIWDKPAETTGISGNGTLVEQTANTGLGLVTDTSLSGTTTNTIDWNTKRGWFLNLGSGGERINVSPQQSKSTLLVVSNKPVTDPCNTGGSSRLFGLDPITGGAPAYAVFDTNATGGITTADAKGYNVKAVAFAVLSLPTIQSRSGGGDVVTTEAAGTRGQTGARLGGVENRPFTASDCAQWLLAGGSDTSIAGFDIGLCSPNKPRISWRQLK